MVGQIISLVLIGLVFAIMMAFFIQKKMLIPSIIYGIIILCEAAFQLLDWFLPNQDFSFAVMILNGVAIVATIIIVIVYQNDFRNIITRLTGVHKKIDEVEMTDEEVRDTINSIVTACQTLSKSRTGALIVIVKDKIDQYILDSGVRLDAKVSAPLLESIFNTKCPMHDGAVVIKGNKILTAGSFLPLTKSESVAKDLGTRHRAGIGVTEENENLISIIISEENGIISTAIGGALRRYLTPERLYDMLYDPYKMTRPEKKKKIKNIF